MPDSESEKASGTLAPASPGPGKRLERIFTCVAIILVVVILAGAFPGRHAVRGYRRARWADRRGLEVVVEASFTRFASALGPSEGALRGRAKVDLAAYRQLRQPGFLEEEAGGDFWSGFYGMGTRLYHHHAGNHTRTPRTGEELRAIAERAVERAARKAEKKEQYEARIAKLVAQLGDREWAKREAAAARLLEIGRPALPALGKALSSPDPEVATRAEALIDGIVGSPRRR